MRHIVTNKLYALKAMLKAEIVAHKQQNNVLNEKNIMAACNHPFVIKLYATFKDERKLYMLLEFVQGGELFAIIHTAKRDGENECFVHLISISFIILFLLLLCHVICTQN